VKLLVVDSDRDMVEMLTGWLKTRGYEVHFAFNAERARYEWVQHQPDLVIINASLEKADALALCRELRCRHDALVLALDNHHDVQAEVRCLESGADDYLRLPFFPLQLLAHIHALSRRVRSTLERRPSSVITVGPIHVDSLRNEVTVRGKTARLTPTESKVLHILAANAGDVCTLEQIVTYVWGYGNEGDTYLIKAHIRHLREKVEADPSNPRYIQTVSGVGYSLRRYAEEEPAAVAEEPEYVPAAPAAAGPAAIKSLLGGATAAAVPSF
jgi:DNA-binding response OmpR family regulator